ncbi:MAG: hypothetical protein ACE5ID_08735 [Acidobacteriota bacterium]
MLAALFSSGHLEPHAGRSELWGPPLFEVDPLRCTCGATMRVIAFILDPAVIKKILAHRPRPEVRAHAPPAG